MVAATTVLGSCCEPDYDNWADPQGYDQEDGVQLAINTAPANAIDMAAVTTDSVKLFSASTSLPAGFAIGETTVKINDQEVIPAGLTSGNVSAEDLTNAVIKLYGRRPEQRVLDVVVNSYAKKGTEGFYLTSDTMQIPVTLVAPEISSAYYVIGGAASWDEAGARTQQFSHSGADVYDDPVFTIVIPAAASGDTWFGIADDKALEGVTAGDWQYVIGTTSGNGNSGESGSLSRRNGLSDDGSFKVDAGSGSYIKVTLNMMDYTYTVEPLNFASFYYAVGGDTSWGDGTPYQLYGANFDGKYQGWYYLSQEFKFKPNADNWDGDLEYTGEGTLSADGSGNIPAPEAGFYQIDLDAANLTYSLKKIETISVVGNYNGWNEKEGAQLTYDAASKTWKGTVTGLTSGFKFVANNNWDLSWGGTVDNLTHENGADLTGYEGDYDVELSISYVGNNKVTLTKK